MDMATIDTLVGLFGVNKTLILLTMGLAALGLGFSVAAFVYARWTHTVSVMVLEKISQEQNARLSALMRNPTPGA